MWYDGLPNGPHTAVANYCTGKLGLVGTEQIVADKKN